MFWNAGCLQTLRNWIFEILELENLKIGKLANLTLDIVKMETWKWNVRNVAVQVLWRRAPENKEGRRKHVFKILDMNFISIQKHEMEIC